MDVKVLGAAMTPFGRHTETVSASPGHTGRLNRPDMDPNRAGSESQSRCSRARPVTP